MTFKLQIELGNAAMLTAENVAGALNRVSYELDTSEAPGSLSGNVRDHNGNTVGSWEFTKAGWQPAFKESR